MASTTYTTKQGDTWDNIALQVYGRESYADYLMQNNYALLDILIFSAGTILNTPEFLEGEDEGLPEWRIDGNEAEDSSDPYNDYD